MNAKSIALIASFAAVAIGLNVVRIPTVYWPGFFYSLYEIPVVIAFLLFGFKIGILVQVLHTAGQLLLFPVGPGGFAAYPMGIVAMLLNFVGLYAGSRFLARKAVSMDVGGRKPPIYLTAFTVATRGGLMPFVDYGVLYHFLLPLVGFSIPETVTSALVPFFILYNVTVPLYTIPIGYIVSKTVSRHLKIEPSLLKESVEDPPNAGGSNRSLRPLANT